MPIPNLRERLGRFVVARVKDEAFAFQAGFSGTSVTLASVARELRLGHYVRDASIIIEVENGEVAMVIDTKPFLEEDLVLGTDFLYLLDIRSWNYGSLGSSFDRS